MPTCKLVKSYMKTSRQNQFDSSYLKYILHMHEKPENTPCTHKALFDSVQSDMAIGAISITVFEYIWSLDQGWSLKHLKRLAKYWWLRVAPKSLKTCLVAVQNKVRKKKGKASTRKMKKNFMSLLYSEIAFCDYKNNFF